MTNKTKQELIEQIKIMNHNYSVIREQKENGYRYSIARIKELEKELADTKKKLDIAVDALKELRPTEKKSCYLVPTVSTTQRIIDEALEQINQKEE